MRRFHLIFWSAVATITVLLGIEVARSPQRLLTIDSGDVKGDVLVVLGGGTIERPERAAELFKAGVAPKVLVSGRGDCESNVEALKKNGVPASAIMEEDLSSNTLENAKFSIPLLRQMSARRVILVTTWYHSRRALACFEHFAPDITFYSRPSYFAYPRREWNRRNVGDCVRAELVKLPGYWVVYGICPYPLSPVFAHPR